MPCPSIQTGGGFLAGVLGNIDCQARTIGAYGFGALSDPGSSAFAVVSVLLTIFIALFGFRLMFGAETSGRDLVGDMLRIGIVLTLATSWPAWRTIGYNVVLSGPGEVAGAVGRSSALPGSQNDLTLRLQNIDDGIVALTMFGSGRLTGDAEAGTGLGDSNRGIALRDQDGFAWGRIAFLMGAIAPLGVVRIGAGLLLAIAPLMAALLLFAGTRDLFFGWLRGLAACALGGVAIAIAQSAQLALLEPWLLSALQLREVRVAAPSAPTELLAMTASFAVISVGLLVLVGRMTFFSSGAVQRLVQQIGDTARSAVRIHGEPALLSVRHDQMTRSRAETVADAVAGSMRREGYVPGGFVERLPQMRSPAAETRRGAEPSGAIGPAERIGSSYRRTQLRRSGAAARRDLNP